MKLDPHDLQFQNYRNFDGMYAYAQNKRQQVVMTRQWSTQWPDIHFSSMHPGGSASFPRHLAFPERERNLLLEKPLKVYYTNTTNPSLSVGGYSIIGYNYRLNE